MNKWEVSIGFVIKAETRREVYQWFERFNREHLDSAANVDRVSLEPLEKPDEWYAANEKDIEILEGEGK